MDIADNGGETVSTKTEQSTAEIAELREYLNETDTIYTIVRSVARSGMSRKMDLYVIRDNTPRRITFSVAKALGWRYDMNAEALHVDGCGMDMGFHTVYSLSQVLYGDGYKLTQRWL